MKTDTTRNDMLNNFLTERVVADELEAAEVVAFDGQERTVTLRFDLMPCAGIGERWFVRPNERLGDCLRGECERMRSALSDILKMSQQHACFDGVAFDKRDIQSLCDQAGDICDWTMIAILAADGLNEEKITTSDKS